MKKMKTAIYILSGTLLISIIAIRCKKDQAVADVPFTCTTCNNTPTATAANNTASKGIYKSVLVGSSGTIVFDVANNGSTLTAKMVIDGDTVNLTSTITPVAGQNLIAPFTGTYKSQPVSITFSVTSTGSNPTVSASNIPGHPNTSFNVIKETSTALVEGFEGTYTSTKPETGVFNLVLQRDAKIFSGNYRVTGSITSNFFTGTIDASGNLIDNATKIVFGQLVNDKISGSFIDGNPATVTITAKRTF